MIKPLLTICIATYNRANFISETINNIVPQLDADVELLIVDGASTDNTESVVQSFADHTPYIRYVCLDAKGGVDQDYCKSVELARGEYCWLFTDDDLLLPGAVSAVKSAIKEGHCLVVVNSEVRDNEMSALLKPRNIDIDEDKVFLEDEFESLFVCAGSHLSFVGAVVIRRDVWLNREKELYFGTEFVHVGVIFQDYLPGSAVIIAEPYIRIRYGNGQWKPRGFEIWMFKWPQLVWSFENVSDRVKRSVTRQNPWRNLAILLFERGIGAYSIQHYQMFLSGLPVSKIWKACASLIARVPEKMSASLLYYYCRFVNPDKMFLYDLDSNR
jgi:glycosyltransferase involved in cell wall biosynthesis